MHAVAQFVRKGHHVARFAEVVQHDIGVHRRDGGVGECAWRLARFDARVDPAVCEERLRDLGHFGRKIPIGIKDKRLGVIPRDGFLFLGRQGRVAIPDLKCFKAQPFRLERVVAV